METNIKLVEFPSLYQVTYKQEEDGNRYTNVFTKLGDGIGFLKYLSTKTSFFSGQICAFKSKPNVISCLEVEDEILFRIFKYDNVVSFS